jgi:hypothetical protein
MTDLLILAVTKMLSGVCIGGVIPGGRRWVRPVKEHGTILVGDVRLADGSLMRPFDIISLNLGKARPQASHVEDVVCDFVRPRPQRVRHVPEGERAALLSAALDPHPEQVWERHERALTLFQPSDFTASFFHDAYSGKFEARVAWPGCGSDRGYSVTDLRWRALGRALLPNGGERCLTWEEIRRQGDGATGRSGEGMEAGPSSFPFLSPSPRRPVAPSPSVYLAVGLSRSFEGKLWPLVVGVHLLPDYTVTVDPRNL